jgi:hypothetical protein
MKMNLRKITMGLGLSIALVACSKEEEAIVLPLSAIFEKLLGPETNLNLKTLNLSEMYSVQLILDNTPLKGGAEVQEKPQIEEELKLNMLGGSNEDAFKNEHEESQMVISSLKIAQKKIETIIEVEPVIEPVVEVEVKLESTYDPKATDGDKDGFVQDGTEFQRPVEETN